MPRPHDPIGAAPGTAARVWQRFGRFEQGSVGGLPRRRRRRRCSARIRGGVARTLVRAGLLDRARRRAAGLHHRRAGWCCSAAGHEGCYPRPVCAGWSSTGPTRRIGRWTTRWWTGPWSPSSPGAWAAGGTCWRTGCSNGSKAPCGPSSPRSRTTSTPQCGSSVFGITPRTPCGRRSSMPSRTGIGRATRKSRWPGMRTGWTP